MSSSVRVLVADDHPAFRAGLQLMLASSDWVEVVGLAESGDEAVAKGLELAPDVVVMDLRMPGLDGIEATRRLLAIDPSVGVLVLTMFEDDESVFSAMRAGARGYLLKGADQDEILRAIRAVAAGEVLLGQSVAVRVIEHFARGDGSSRAAFPSRPHLRNRLLPAVRGSSPSVPLPTRRSSPAVRYGFAQEAVAAWSCRLSSKH